MRGVNLNAPVIIVGALATLAAFFAAGYSLAGFAYDRLHRGSR